MKKVFTATTGGKGQAFPASKLGLKIIFIQYAQRMSNTSEELI